MSTDEHFKEGEMNLDYIKEHVTWDSLIELHTDSLNTINLQMLLVDKLRDQCKGTLPNDIADAFTGLRLSFKDLTKEVLDTGVIHAEETKTLAGINGIELLHAKKFYVGNVTDDDQALTYINAAGAYLNIQDKTQVLISTGWVDLFVKLKMDVDELIAGVSRGVAEATK